MICDVCILFIDLRFVMLLLGNYYIYNVFVYGLSYFYVEKIKVL